MMGLEAKTLVLFLPVVAAVMWGLAYATAEQVMSKVGMSTYAIIDIFTKLIVTIFMIKLFGQPDMVKIFSETDLLIKTIVCAMASGIGYFCAIYSIKHISAVYTSALEIMYPVFVVLFAVLLYHARDIHWTTLLGGGMILSGALVVVVGKNISLVGKG